MGQSRVQPMERSRRGAGLPGTPRSWEEWSQPEPNQAEWSGSSKPRCRCCFFEEPTKEGTCLRGVH